MMLLHDLLHDDACCGILHDDFAWILPPSPLTYRHILIVSGEKLMLSNAKEC